MRSKVRKCLQQKSKSRSKSTKFCKSNPNSSIYRSLDYRALTGWSSAPEKYLQRLHKE